MILAVVYIFEINVFKECILRLNSADTTVTFSTERDLYFILSIIQLHYITNVFFWNNTIASYIYYYLFSYFPVLSLTCSFICS